MVSLAALTILFQQPLALPILIVTDREIDAVELKQIRDSSEPERLLKEKGYRLRMTPEAVYARVPDLYRLETSGDRIEAARELAFAARRADQGIKVKELTPGAVRGLLSLSEESWTEEQRALLFRGEATIRLRGSVAVAATISGKRLFTSISQSSGGEDVLNEPPTEAEMKALRNYRPSPSRAFSKLEFHFVRAGASDLVMDYCSEESSRLAEELKAQNKQLLDMRTNLSMASGMQDLFKMDEAVGRYPQLKERMEETARSTFQQYGFSSFKEVTDGLSTAKIDMVRPSVNVTITVKGASTRGSFQLVPRRY